MALEISRSQMVEPALASDQAFADWFVGEWMPIELPDYCYRQDPRTLKDMTVSARDYARRLGFADVESQALFVNLCWELGPGFFLWPGFREIATDPDLTGPQKIAALEAVDTELAVDAIVGRDSGMWFDAPVPPMREWRSDG